MNESMGNSLLLYLVLIFAGVVMLFFVGIISYSKAYRVKNRIIEIIESENGYTTCSSGEKCATSLINESLREAGYSVSNSRQVTNLCTNASSKHANTASLNNLNNGAYHYCVFEVTGNSENTNGKYYVVTAFVHFDIPIIGQAINIPVYGETKIMNKTYDYE